METMSSPETSLFMYPITTWRQTSYDPSSSTVHLVLTSAVTKDGDTEFARNVTLHVPYYNMASDIIWPEHRSAPPGNLESLAGFIVVHENSLLLGCYTVSTINTSSCEVWGSHSSWNVTYCRWGSGSRRFIILCCLHRQGQAVWEPQKRH